MRRNRIIYKGQIWPIVLNDFPKSTREIKRAFIECVGYGNAVKWGHLYDIALPEKQMIPTNCRRTSDMMTWEWVVMAIENLPDDKRQGSETIKRFLDTYNIEFLKSINTMPV